MNKAAATRLLQAPGLFDEDNVAAEVYLYELDFHNQLKARLLEHKVARLLAQYARACSANAAGQHSAAAIC